MRGRVEQDAAFTEFVAARSDALFRSAYLLTTTRHGAEDLLQTTLLKVYEGWRKVDAARDPVAYAHGVLFKTFLSERRLRRSGEVPVAEAPERAGASGDPEDRLALLAALAALPPTDRAVVVLRHWHDLSVAETASDLGISQAAVKNRSPRALRRLRDLLGEGWAFAEPSTTRRSHGD